MIFEKSTPVVFRSAFSLRKGNKNMRRGGSPYGAAAGVVVTGGLLILTILEIAKIVVPLLIVGVLLWIVMSLWGKL